MGAVCLLTLTRGPAPGAVRSFWADAGIGNVEAVETASNDDLIASAAAVLNPRTVDGRPFGDVGCSLVTVSGGRYQGVCIDTPSGTGFCAEHAAIAAMVTAGEFQITKIVAVWRDDDGTLAASSNEGPTSPFLPGGHYRLGANVATRGPANH